MEPIIYKGQKVITTELLAMAYETETQNIHKNFSRSQGKFIEGKHYFYLEGDDLRTFKDCLTNSPAVDKHTRNLYLWTERGANRHCKILDTDKAWQQFDNLEDTYFRAKRGLLGGPCDVKYLNGVANYLRTQRTIMKENGSTPKEIAEMSQTVCRKYDIPLPADFVRINPYEQLTLME